MNADRKVVRAAAFRLRIKKRRVRELHKAIYGVETPYHLVELVLRILRKVQRELAKEVPHYRRYRSKRIGAKGRGPGPAA